jgi:hypothetical protein
MKKDPVQLLKVLAPNQFATSATLPHANHSSKDSDSSLLYFILDLASALDSVPMKIQESILQYYLDYTHHLCS